jgi:hypothetical protein
MKTSTIDEKTSEPKLDKPGAGLPFFEWFVAKHLLVPILFITTSRQKAIQKFLSESEQIVRLAESLTSQQFAERRLIKRLRGLEDSSRYWSVAMTIEHLVIVGGGTRRIVKNLARGITEMPPSSTAAVKPHEDVDAARVIEDFKAMTDALAQTAKVTDFTKHPNAKFDHPWFGPMTAAQWLIFSPMHQRLHRQQIEEIIKLL